MSMQPSLEINTQTKEEIQNYKEMVMPNPRIAEINTRMSEIVSRLKETDYKNNKWVQGDLSEEEWIAYKTECIALREEYKALEAELKAL